MNKVNSRYVLMYENFRTGKRYKNKRLAIKNSNVGDEIARYRNINKDWNGNAPGLYLQPLDDYIVESNSDGKKYFKKVY